MPQQDSPAFRSLLSRLLPGLNIKEVARPSGQRIVYFGNFTNLTNEDRAAWKDENPCAWGDVAIKISSGISPEAITYLQREIRILNGLNSKFYPTLYFDEVYSQDPQNEETLDKRLFITVETFVSSEALSNCLDNYQTETAVVELLIQLTAGLRLLWEQKPPLIHRDIKPDNILIANDGAPVIIDLGIAREQGSDGETKTEWLWGPCTPHFSSPEQARNDKRNISFKSDVFALGTLAYLLITKTNPYRPNEQMPVTDILARVVNHTPPCLIDTANVSKEFSDLISKMMQKEPYRRPRTPKSLLLSLINIQRLVNDD